jgi:hypothetical protein
MNALAFASKKRAVSAVLLRQPSPLLRPATDEGFVSKPGMSSGYTPMVGMGKPSIKAPAHPGAAQLFPGGP